MPAPHQRAYRVEQHDERVTGGIVELPVPAPPPGGVLIRCEFAGVNFKDALSAQDRARIVRSYPRVLGIEATGRVERSNDPRFGAGDAVIVHGFGLGSDCDGGFARWLAVPAEFVLRLPESLELREAATIGVAGYTAALAIDAMETNGLVPDSGPVAVNGATGGVASVAIAMLARRGYRVHALTRKSEESEYLRSLGASEVEPPLEVGSKPLETARWAGAVDSLGGAALDGLLRTMQPGGVVASFGNAAGNDLHSSVLPFILRGVRLIGINANSPMPLRERIWGRIGSDLRPRDTSAIARPIPLERLPEAFDALLAGRARGRFVVEHSD